MEDEYVAAVRDGSLSEIFECLLATRDAESSEEGDSENEEDGSSGNGSEEYDEENRPWTRLEDKAYFGGIFSNVAGRNRRIP